MQNTGKKEKNLQKKELHCQALKNIGIAGQPDKTKDQKLKYQVYQTGFHVWLETTVQARNHIDHQGPQSEDEATKNHKIGRHPIRDQILQHNLFKKYCL